MTTTSTDRLGRLLALVPYVVSRRSVSLAEAAAAFGVTEKQLIDDLNMLWCVELRAPDPYCPIDLSYEGGEQPAGGGGARPPGRAEPRPGRADPRAAAAPDLLRAGPRREHRARRGSDA